MKVVVQNITTLSKAYRDIAFPIRLLRTLLVSVVSLMLIASVGGLIYLEFFVATSASGPPSVSTDVHNDADVPINLVIVSLIFISILSSAFFAARGYRLAIFFLLIAIASGFLIELVEFTKLSFNGGFVTYDLSKLPSDTQLSDDLRFIPLTIYRLAFLLAAFFLVFRLAKIYLLPKNRGLLPFTRVLFDRKFDLSLLRVYMGVFGWKTLLLWRLYPSLVMYAIYFLFLLSALYQPIYLTTARAQYSIVIAALGDSSIASSLSYDLAELYIREILRLGFALALSRLLFFLSNVFRKLSNHLGAFPAHVMRTLDKRAPVLYLRSFRSDVLRSGTERDSGPAGVFDPYREQASVEDVIVRRCFAIGPVIAIRDPKALFRPAGAAHFLVRDMHWHDAADMLMNEAAMVLVLLDDTDNLKWEIERLCDHGLLLKTAFLFLPAEDEASQERISQILEAAVFHGQPQLFSCLDFDETVRAIRKDASGWRVIKSSTWTISDYDVALRLITTPL